MNSIESDTSKTSSHPHAESGRLKKRSLIAVGLVAAIFGLYYFQMVGSSSALDKYLDKPIPSEYVEQVNMLHDSIKDSNGNSKRENQQKLAMLYRKMGRIDQAAVVQKEIAGQSNSFAEYRLAGDYFFHWIRTLEDSGQSDPEIANEAIGQYTQALQLSPNNLDARMDLASVYLYSTTPSLAVDELKKVIAFDSENVRAHYNLGVAHSQLEQPELALEAFGKVLEYAEPETAEFVRSQRAVHSLGVPLDHPGAVAPTSSH